MTTRHIPIECATHHEIALDEGKLICQALFLGVVGSPLDLVVVVVETRDVSTGELGDLACRPANAAADIQHFHALLDADLVGKIMLVSGNGLIEAFSERVAAKMERLAPTVFVQIGGEIVVSGEEHVSDSKQKSGESGSYCLVNVAYSAVRAC